MSEHALLQNTEIFSIYDEAIIARVVDKLLSSPMNEWKVIPINDLNALHSKYQTIYTDIGAYYIETGITELSEIIISLGHYSDDHGYILNQYQLFLNNKHKEDEIKVLEILGNI